MTSMPASHPVASTALLVDDEEGVRSYCRRVLEAEGVRVVEAADGEVALRLVQQAEHAFDIVITDLLMPAITGREVAEVLAIFRPELPVLCISADAGGGEERRLRVLRKPFTPDELIAAVGQARQRSRETRGQAQERRERARLLQEAAMAAQLEARR